MEKLYYFFPILFYFFQLHHLFGNILFNEIYIYIDLHFHILE